MHFLILFILVIGICKLLSFLKLWKWVLMAIIMIVVSGFLCHLMEETHQVPETLSFYFGSMILIGFVANWGLNYLYRPKSNESLS